MKTIAVNPNQLDFKQDKKRKNHHPHKKGADMVIKLVSVTLRAAKLGEGGQKLCSMKSEY